MGSSSSPPFRPTSSTAVTPFSPALTLVVNVVAGPPVDGVVPAFRPTSSTTLAPSGGDALALAADVVAGPPVVRVIAALQADALDGPRPLQERP